MRLEKQADGSAPQTGGVRRCGPVKSQDMTPLLNLDMTPLLNSPLLNSRNTVFAAREVGMRPHPDCCHQVRLGGRVLSEVDGDVADEVADKAPAISARCCRSIR